jgi:hypothetical protein
MPRTTGSTELDNELRERLSGGHFRSRLEMDRWNGSSWVSVDDLSGDSPINWTDSVVRRQYLNYGIQPVPNTISFNVYNENGKYSPGSGEAEDDVLQIGTKIRIRHIYPLSTGDVTLYRSVFHLDKVIYNVNNTSIDTVVCRGRDAYKFAIDKSVVIDDLSGGVTIDQLIKDICDQIGILYTGSSIADLSSFGNRTIATGLGKAKKADEIFEILMAIINQSGSVGYQMYLDYDDSSNDNVLYVQEIPSLYEADFVFTEREIMSIGSFQKDGTRFIQRMSCFTTNETPDERENLGSATYTTNGQQTLSLSKNALYKTYTVTVNSGSPTVVLDQVNNGSLVFTISNAGSVTITVYGAGLSTFPTYAGESINHASMVANIGQTVTMESLLFESDDECRKTAEGAINKFANPDKEAQQLLYPYCNTYLITNDMTFPFIRNIFELDLYYITGVNHSWSFYNESTSYDLQDSGLNWTDIYSGFIYDSDYLSWPPQGALQAKPSTNLAIKYDIGAAYDMTYGPNADETTIPQSGFEIDIPFS